MIKNTQKIIIKYSLLLVGLVIVGYLLLVLVYCIPNERMENNVRLSINTFSTEGYYYSPAAINLDNYTDALKLIISANKSNENPWMDSLRGTYLICTNKDITPTERLVDYYSTRENTYEFQDYSRYWHGYQIFLRPLLCFCTYAQIRSLLAMVQLTVFSIVLGASVKIRKIEIGIANLTLWIFMNPVATMSSLQFNPVFLIMELAICGMLWNVMHLRPEEMNETNIYLDAYGYYFFVIGASTSYFDFLTFPIVTLGVSLIVWMYLYCWNNSKKELYELLIKSILWGIGYAGMWIGKWILTTVVLRENIIIDGFDQIMFRTLGSTNARFDVPYLTIISRQIGYAMQYPCLIIAMILVLLCSLKVFRGNRQNIRKWAKIFDPVFLIFLYPFLWYLFARNHSYYHDWMTFRNLGIIVFGVTLLAVRRLKIS